MALNCLDLSYERVNGHLSLRALVKTDDGKELVEMPAPFDPYCYVENDGLVFSELKSAGARIGDGAPDGFVKVEVDHPADLRSFRDRCTAQTYEADVDYATRALVDMDSTVQRPDPGDVLYFDIEVDDRGSFTPPSEATDRIISIAGVGGDGREIYHDTGDEDDLIRSFLSDADDYAVLAGWNSVGYDFEYLEERCAVNGIDADWRRWVRLDVMPLYDMLGVPTKTVSTKLDDTGEREVGAGKTGVQAGGGRLYELWETDPGTLREYNIRDCELVKEIDEKFGLVDLLHVVCDLCNYPPGEACYESKHGQVRFAIGQIVDAKLLEVAGRRGIPQPNRGHHEKGDDFPGGYVLDPEPGMYEDVVAPDYSGMYPNIVRAWNFGRETFVPEDDLVYDADKEQWYVVDGEYAGCRAIKGESGGFVHPDDGDRSVPAEAADELVEMREGAPDIIDKGVKAIANTLFGVFASDFHRYFGPHSENITLIGQELTGKVEDIAGDGHTDIVQVVYGDSVPGYEPVVWRRDGETRVTRIDEVPRDADKVRGSGGWTTLERVIEKPNRKQMYRVITGAGVVRVTEDHSLILADGEERSPEDVEPGDRLLHNPTHESDLGPISGGEYEPTDEEAWLLGVFAGDGSAGSYTIDGGEKHQWKVAKNDAELLHKVGSALERVHGVGYRVRDSYTDDSTFVTPTKTIKPLAVEYRNRCYNDAGNKVVPSDVLNGGRECVLSFLAGYARADGENEPRSNKLLTRFSTKSRPLAQGIRVLLERLGTGMGVEIRKNHGNEYIRAWPRQWTRSDTAVVESVEPVDYDGDHVYDLTTADESFGAGVGDIVVHNTDSIMVSMDDPDDPVEAAQRVSADVEAEMKEWARSRGAFAEHLELDVDDVYSRFYIGDKKKRYFGNRIYDGEPCDDFKVRGFETRQGSWPEPVRELQEELMHALLDDEPTGPIVSRYKDELFKGLHDDELHESKKLGQPVDDYPHPMPHTRAAEAIREEYGDGAVQVDDKVDYIKYGDGKTDVVHVHDGIGAEFRPNDHYCPECDKVVRGDHEHETAGHPHLRDEHYSYIWEEKYLSVMGSIGVSEHEQTGLGAFA